MLQQDKLRDVLRGEQEEIAKDIVKRRGYPQYIHTDVINNNAHFFTVLSFALN